jgi:WD40 repeat protein
MRNATLAAESGLSLPPDSYVYCIAALDQAFVAISSDDSLRAFDRQTLQILSGGIIEKIHSSVTCLAASPNAVFTAGRDGLIRTWDLRTGKREVEVQDGRKPVPMHCNGIYVVRSDASFNPVNGHWQ